MIAKTALCLILVVGAYIIGRTILEDGNARYKEEVRVKIENAPTGYTDLSLHVPNLKVDLEGGTVKFRLEVIEIRDQAAYVLAREKGKITTRLTFYIGTPVSSTNYAPTLILSTGDNIYSRRDTGIQECFVWARRIIVAGSSDAHQIWVAIPH